MVAKTHRELQAWQLADTVRRRVIKLCKRPEVRKDFEFCDQADRAAGSACRNLAEGFARYHHPDFARFVVISLSSLTELADCLDEALSKEYIDRAEFDDFDAAVRSAIKTANGLRRYLQNTPTPKERLKYGPKARTKHKSTQHPRTEH